MIMETYAKKVSIKIGEVMEIILFTLMFLTKKKIIDAYSNQYIN